MRYYLTGESADAIRQSMWRYRLTPREIDIAWEYVHGMPQREIALLLGVGSETVKSNLTTIRRKCGFDVTAGEKGVNNIRFLRHLAGAEPVAYRKSA